MGQKLRQIADTVHQTVYLSELESNLMSTAYFYRLHDVYQSSTVYLTFPCNRTKRYEHSYGTMELAGEMFFAAITNASETVLAQFFKEAEVYFRTITETLLGGDRATYCESSLAEISSCFPPTRRRELGSICDTVMKDAFTHADSVGDVALNHYMPPFSKEQASKDVGRIRFLYQCLLEAVRIVALFHDVGHPPYSHIIETILTALYAECNESPNDNERKQQLLTNLQPFMGETNDGIQCFLSPPVLGNSDFHEQVGLQMLVRAFDYVFPAYFREILDFKSRWQKSTHALYYITVAEFCIAILRDLSPFFTSLHRIVDGCMDADRMDYIVRDSRNSAVDWGTIPYKRIIESCKLIECSHEGKCFYQIAYPQKMAEHIDDLLKTRYKIFTRINYHHRSFKTALILQKIVQVLAQDYLNKTDNGTVKTLCPDIDFLWNCLESTLTSGDLYIIQWNDSTLISHLYQTLTEVKRSSADDYGLPEEEYNAISEMLEEFLLNRKYYYSVFKRQSDIVPIISDVVSKLTPLIDTVKQYEEKKYKEAQTEKEIEAANDSLKRLSVDKITGIVRAGDIDTFSRIFPINIKEIIEAVLSEYKKRGLISKYLFAENDKRTRTGLPKREDGSDRIYLYDPITDQSGPYDVSNLEKQLTQLQDYCLQYIAYIKPADVHLVTQLIEMIRMDIGKRIYDAAENCMKELFSCLR